MRRCTKCGIEKDLCDFGKPKKSYPNPPCRLCINAAARELRNRPEVAARIKVQQKAQRMKNKEKHRAQFKRWNDKNRDYVREHKTKLRESRFGDDIYIEIAAKQKARICDSCEEKQTGSRRLSVDHDHVSGRYRGVLCSRCNTALGLLDDSTNKMLRLVDYQLRYQEKDS